MSDNEQISYADDAREQPLADQPVAAATPPAYDPATHQHTAEPTPELPVYDGGAAPERPTHLTALPTPEWLSPPPHLKGKKRDIWIATHFAEARDARLVRDVVCPDFTEVLRKVDPEANPFTVRVRAQRLDEMIAAGAVPEALKDEIEAFNSELAIYQYENERREGESDQQFTNRGIAATIRATGIMEFNRNQKQIQDITICECAVEPRIVADAMDILDPEAEMALEHFSDADRMAIFNAIQEATGGLTAAELKSVVAAAEAETDHAVVAPGEGDTPAAV